MGYLKTSWRELLTKEMERHGDSTAQASLKVAAQPTFQFDYYESYEDGCPKRACFLDGSWLDASFGFEWSEGCVNFTIWSHTRVYFPVQYDSSWSVGSVPRDPCNETASYFGGG